VWTEMWIKGGMWRGEEQEQLRSPG
jgi:hypothetical protein